MFCGPDAWMVTGGSTEFVGQNAQAQMFEPSVPDIGCFRRSVSLSRRWRCTSRDQATSSQRIARPDIAALSTGTSTSAAAERESVSSVTLLGASLICCHSSASPGKLPSKYNPGKKRFEVVSHASATFFMNAAVASKPLRCSSGGVVWVASCAPKPQVSGVLAPTKRGSMPMMS